MINEVFVTGIVHSFETDNSKRLMSCIGMALVTYYIGLVMIWKVLVTGMLYCFAIIIETIIVVAGVLGYGFVLGILYNFVLVFGIWLVYIYISLLRIIIVSVLYQSLLYMLYIYRKRYHYYLHCRVYNL